MCCMLADVCVFILQYAVTLNDFYDLMLSHRVGRDECFQVVRQICTNRDANFVN